MKRQTKRDVAADVVRTVIQGLGEGKSAEEVAGLVEEVIHADRLSTLASAQEAISRRYQPYKAAGTLAEVQAYEASYATITGVPLEIVRHQARNTKATNRSIQKEPKQ